MRVTDVPLIIRQQLEINKLNLKVDSLEEIIKNNLFYELMSKINEPLENARLKKEVTRLRKKVKTLKEIIKDGK